MKIPNVEPVDESFALQAQAHWDNLIKPKGSLGRLEKAVNQICAIRRTTTPVVQRKKIVVIAADHGIAEEGVSAYPQEVTEQMVRGFLSGRAAINVLARSCGIELEIVDSGIRSDILLNGLTRLHIRNGTRNFLHEPAMSRDEMERAVMAGVQLATKAAGEGVDLIGGGEMGIANSTSAAAIYTALLDLPASEVTGYGTGITHEEHRHKVAVIQQAIRRSPVSDPLEVLKEFGGYEIASLTGFYIGAAAHRIPVVIDGYICTAAAAIAMKLSPAVRNYFFFAHCSAERGYRKVIRSLEIEPLLNLEMRLGEGTGGALAMQLIENAVHLYMEMPTFQEAEVSGRLQ